MKCTFILLSIGGLLTLALSSCKKDYLDTDSLKSQSISGTVTFDDETRYAEDGDATVIGDQLPIPYTIENMKAAYISLLIEPENEGNRSLYMSKHQRYA